MADDDAPARPEHSGHRHMTVQSDAATSLGVYANMMMVSHRKGEFVMDFLFVPPQTAGTTQSSATLRTRVITTPEHAKRIVRALAENLNRYEGRFGEVTEAAAPEDRKVH